MKSINTSRKLYSKIGYYFVFAFMFAGSLLFNPFTAYAFTGNGAIIVHITNTGACYHTEGCGSLRSDIEISLEDAYVAGYQRCSKCNPPIYTGTAKRQSLKEKHISGSSGEKANTRAGIVSANDVKTVSAKGTSETPILLGFLGLVGFWILANIIRSGLEHRKEIILRQREYEARRKYYETNYKGRSIEEIIDAPEGVHIKRDGTVIKGQTSEEKPYGELTVFVSYYGKRYHSNHYCRNVHGMVPINIYNAISCGYTACYKCGVYQRIPEWYIKIPQVLKLINEFQSEEG